MEELLKEIGLSEIESKVYLSLIKEGPSTAAEVSKRSGVYRTNIYDALQGLIVKGLASYILTKRVKIFSATNPDVLEKLFNEKERKLKQKFAESLPEMIRNYNKSRIAEETRIYKGLEGVKTIIEDAFKILKPEDEWVWIQPTVPKQKAMSKEYAATFVRRIEENKIKMKILFSDNEYGKIEAKQYKSPLIKIRFLPLDYSSPAGIHVYKDIVVIRLYSKESTSVIMESEQVAKSFKSYFEILWKLVD